jgi:hypothetical protein
MQVPAPPPADKIKSRIAARQSSHGCNDIELLAASAAKGALEVGLSTNTRYDWALTSGTR